MGTLPPPTEYFPGIIFNEAYYKAANFIVTKEYIDNNFLKSVGYAYSRAIFTNFSGLVYAIGGISTSDITATGTITAAFFTGSGANLTNLNASNITDGTLSVSRGGTGLNTIPLGSLLIGNGANTLLQTTNLSWDNTNSILNATNFSGSHSGSGAGLINLNVSNANAGTLPIGRGGTGATSFIGGRLLYGDGVNPLAQSANLTWNNTNNTLNTTNVNSSAYFINGSPFTPYTLPTANAATLGGIKVGNNLSIDGNGVLSATSSGLTGADIFLDGGVNNRAYGWTGATSLLGRVGTAGAYSLNSLAEDVILRSQGRILLQSGTNVPGVTIETTTNNVIIRNSLGIGITTFGAGDILDVGGVFKVAYNGVAESITIRSTGINVNNTLNVSSGTNNGGIIRFGGFSDDTSLDLATIQNRQYATNKSELLLFKGDNIEGLTGADRIRLRAAAIAFDTFSTDVTTSATTENIRMYIDNSGSVGIGTTTPLSSYLLDVRGNIVSTGNIALVNASRSIFWTGTNSNLARAGVAGEYSTSAAINDIVLRSGNNLILQSGTGAAAMVITTSNNIGIGITNPPFALLHLHKTALAQDVRIQFTDGTTGAASTDGLVIGKGTNGRNFIYNYENSDLYFGTNTLERMTISGAGNVGIANTAPIAPLTIGNSALANNDGFLVLEKCTTVGTTRQFRIGLNANFDLAMGDYGGNNVAGTWLESFKISYQSPANALVINSSGNIGVNTSNPTSKVHINHSSTSTSPDSGGSIGLYVNNPTNLLNNNSIICNRVAGILCGKVIYSLDVYGAHGWSIYITAISNVFRINNSYTASGTDVLTIDQAGNATIYGSITGTGIISSSFLQGSGAGGAYRIVRPDTWVRLKNTADTDHLNFAAGRLYAHYQLDVVGAATFSAFTIHNAEVRVRMQSVSNTANEYVCIKTTGGTTDGPLGNYYDKILYIAYNTFTGFHRCYIDDELCNDDNIDIFKNDFVGRIVISTGKIKTDASRKKIIENQLEDTPDEYEWYSLEDKEGITIEDALPKVKLSRIRKDKRVYGVLGDPNRGTNNKDRIIVNGCGEGAICVCNRNGNIENGDYIQTSDILGYGEKQDDDLLHNYTVAKSVMDCNFELDSPYYQSEELADGTRVAIIACVYKTS